MATNTAPAAVIAPSRNGSAPIDAVEERLNDPTVAAALVTILDNAELLSTLILGLSGFVERGDTIIETVHEAVVEFKAGTSGGTSTVLGLGQLRELATMLEEGLPTLTALLRSSLVSPATLASLAVVGDAATDGLARARTTGTTVTGPLSALKALKDPEVARGVGVLIEVARDLGRRVATTPR